MTAARRAASPAQLLGRDAMRGSGGALSRYSIQSTMETFHTTRFNQPSIPGDVTLLDDFE